MSRKSRDKGKRGERIIIDWLQPIVDEVYKAFGMEKVVLQRNTVQSDDGGSDICGLDWLAAEVKNCEAQGPAAMADWWRQTVYQATKYTDAKGEPRLPVLFYTRARASVRVRMMGWTGGHGVHVGLPCLVDIDADTFEGYFRARLAHELTGRKRS